MTRRSLSIRNLLTAVLISALVTAPLRGVGAGAVAVESGEYEVEFPVGVIGMIETSGAVIIDGRPSGRLENLLGGELIEARPGSSARLLLPSVGQVTLGSNAIARITSVAAGEEAQQKSHVLVASLLAGEMAVQLEAAASGYIQAGASSLLAYEGGSLQVAVRDGQALLSRVNGYVESLGTWMVRVPAEVVSQRANAVAAATTVPVSRTSADQEQHFSMAALGQLTLSRQPLPRRDPVSTRPLLVRGSVSGHEVVLKAMPGDILNDKDRWVLQLPASVLTEASARKHGTAIRAAYQLKPLGLGSSIYVHGRSSQTIQVRVTDEKGQPVVGIPVMFNLGTPKRTGQSIGYLLSGGQNGAAVRAVTSDKGVASAVFTAENRDGAVPMSVYVDGAALDENLRWDSEINVQQINQNSGGSGKKRMILIFAAAAAAAGIAIALSRRDKAQPPAAIVQPPNLVGGVVICPFPKC